MPDGPDTVLLDRLLHDDDAAWGEIVEKYSGLLLAIARRTFSSYGFDASGADCEDAVADVWGNLLRNNRRLIRQCLTRGQLLPMLHVLTRNRTIDVMRRRNLVTQPLDEELTALPADDGDGDDHSELIARLPQLLAALSAKERTLIELFFLQQKKYREIELLTGISLNSIGPTLNRALAKLRELLGADPAGDDARPPESTATRFAVRGAR